MGARRVLARLILAAIAFAAAAGPAQAARKPEIAVQPVDTGKRGKVLERDGQAVRRAVVRAVRSRGLRVTTDVPRAQGTGQYYTWAREAGLRAFVSTELEQVGTRRRATLLVWNGDDGSIVGRWTVTARARELPNKVARGFWPRLGRSLKRAKLPPEWRQMAPGPTQRIYAGSARDEVVSGYHVSRRRSAILR